MEQDDELRQMTQNLADASIDIELVEETEEEEAQASLSRISEPISLILNLNRKKILLKASLAF